MDYLVEPPVYEVATYVNKGTQATPNSTTGPQPRTWLESASMQKEAGTWKILFFHSTPARQP